MLELPLTKLGFAFYLELPPVAAERRDNLHHKETTVRMISDESGETLGTGHVWPFWPGDTMHSKEPLLGIIFSKVKPATISVIISQ